MEAEDELLREGAHRTGVGKLWPGGPNIARSAFFFKCGL